MAEGFSVLDNDERRPGWNEKFFFSFCINQPFDMGRVRLLPAFAFQQIFVFFLPFSANICMEQRSAGVASDYRVELCALFPVNVHFHIQTQMAQKINVLAE